MPFVHPRTIPEMFFYGRVINRLTDTDELAIECSNIYPNFFWGRSIKELIKSIEHKLVHTHFTLKHSLTPSSSLASKHRWYIPAYTM